MIREPDRNFDPPEDPEWVMCPKCAKDHECPPPEMCECGYWLEDVEPDDDPGPIIDRDCDYWNRL